MTVLAEKWPVLDRHVRAAEWLQIWSDLGRASRTIDAYARGLGEFLLACERAGVDPEKANRAQIAVFVRELRTRAKITPNTLTRAYTEAGYFSRNLRTIEVLVDRDAVTTGAAADGTPWQHYDLGHGYCTYSFFEQCQNRMACARCDFYTPKESIQAQLLEAKANLQRMLVSIPLTDDERAAVDDGQTALDALLDRLAEVPTPDGSSPREPGRPTATNLLPIIEVRQGTKR